MKAHVITGATGLTGPWTYCEGFCPADALHIVFPISPEVGKPLDVVPAPWVRRGRNKALDTARWWAETRGIASVVRCSACGHVAAFVLAPLRPAA